MSDFADLLNSLWRGKYRSVMAFAKALEMSPSRVLRATKGEFSFDTLNCLRLAKLTGISPDRVLRAAGKSAIADLITDLYGAEAPVLDRNDELHLVRWRRLPVRWRETLASLIEEVLMGAGGNHGTTRHAPRERGVVAAPARPARGRSSTHR
jgi:hypothetical protein